MTVPKTDVVVFLTHVFDEEITGRFHKLARECAGSCDVVALVPRETPVPRNLLSVTHRYDFSSLGPTATALVGEGVVPGNCHLRSVDFYRKFPGYRHYWFVEYDVVYTGDWGTLLASLAEDQSDLLAAHVRGLRDHPSWYWRDTFSTGACTIPPDRRIMAFMPIHRISGRGLETVGRKVNEGWAGHFEMLVPTALVNSGLPVADFGGSGAWTPAGRRNRHYLDWCGEYTLATVRHYPPVRLRPARNMLYHPCKTAGSAVATCPTRAHKRLLRRKPHLVLGYWLKLLHTAAVSQCRGGRGRV